MEYTIVLVCLVVISIGASEGAGLLQGDAQDQIFSQSAQNSSPAPPQLGPLSNIFLDEAEKENDVPYVRKTVYPSRGVIHRSFSLVTTKPPTTPHFEALRNSSASPRPRTLYIDNQRVEVEDPRDILREFTSLRRGQQNGDYSGPYGVKTYEERIAESASRSNTFQTSGPSPQYSPDSTTENYPLKDISSTLGSFSYATPTKNSRGNVRYSTSSEPNFDSSVSNNWIYDQSSIRRAYVEPTTYRPLFKPTPSPSEYTFSFRTSNHSREEMGNSRGSFRGSIKFADTLGNNKEIHYAASPEIGLVTSEVPRVSNPGRSGNRRVTRPPYASSTESPFAYAPSSSTPSPYSPDSRTPSPYSPDGRTPSPYGRTPSPYSPDSRTPSPYPASSTPFPQYSPSTTEYPPYSQSSSTFPPYAASSTTPAPYPYPSVDPFPYQPIRATPSPFTDVPYSATPSPYGPSSVTPTPYAPNGGAFSYSFVTNAPVDNDLRYGKSYGSTENYPSSRSLPTPDGSYVFSFDAGDHERRETRDRDGRVRGMYSYETPEGEKKVVEYEAGAGQGFVAQGSHLPVQENRRYATTSDEDQPASSYFFSYDAGDHARQEVRDSDGNVRGFFSFLTGDGIKKTVHYRANPEDGFHIENTHFTRTQVK